MKHSYNWSTMVHGSWLKGKLKVRLKPWATKHESLTINTRLVNEAFVRLLISYALGITPWNTDSHPCARPPSTLMHGRMLWIRTFISCTNHVWETHQKIGNYASNASMMLHPPTIVTLALTQHHECHEGCCNDLHYWQQFIAAWDLMVSGYEVFGIAMVQTMKFQNLKCLGSTEVQT